MNHLSQTLFDHESFLHIHHTAYHRIGQGLRLHLKKYLPNHQFKEACLYPLFPAGKYFRPLLAEFIHQDLLHHHPHLCKKDHDSSLLYWQYFLELHHTYTLVHDDLPCMDNDDFRRGKPSTHKQYDEAIALLVGDGLLNLSYQMISLCHHELIPILLRLSTWAVGIKGTILGQIMDYQASSQLPFSTILQIHKLKTARLIQLSILGAMGISQKPMHTFHQFSFLKKGLRLGEHLGMSFQLLDDILDLNQLENNSTARTNNHLHEIQINPFINFPQESMNVLLSSLTFLKEYFRDHAYPQTYYFIKSYLEEHMVPLQNISKNNNFLNDKHNDAHQGKKDHSLEHLLQMIQSF
jgi:geranylgeranyl pyrophosphate synthase